MIQAVLGFLGSPQLMRYKTYDAPGSATDKSYKQGQDRDEDGAMLGAQCESGAHDRSLGTVCPYSDVDCGIHRHLGGFRVTNQTCMSAVVLLRNRDRITLPVKWIGFGCVVVSKLYNSKDGSYRQAWSKVALAAVVEEGASQ